MSEKDKNPNKSTMETTQVLISTPKAAKMLGIGKSLFSEMASDGRLGPTPIKFGRRTLWSVQELTDWIRKGQCVNREKWQEIKKGVY